MIATEYEFEPTPGLPQVLPQDEAVLWKGRPDAIRLAVESMRLRWIAVYFGLIVVWQLASSLHDGAPIREVLLAPLWTILLALVAIGVLGGVGWGLARSTIYTLTTKRLVIRHGLALPMAINIPFSKIDAAALRLNRDGSGDIPLTLERGNRVAYLALWPHARPFHMMTPQPMLRAVPQAGEVSQRLSRALAETVEAPAPSVVRVVRRPAAASSRRNDAEIGSDIAVAS